MRQRIQTILFSTCLGLAASTAPIHAGLEQTATSLWNDPTFIKEFTGSYGFLAGYEPKVSDEEKEALRTLIDLIKVNPSAAIKELEPQVKNSSSAAFDFILANLFFQEANLEKAATYYKNAVVKHPDFRRAYQNLGLVQVQSKEYAGAIQSLSKALELGVVDGRAYGLLGYCYLTQGKYYPAEAAYKQAILMQPEVVDWKVGLAHCLLETERNADAIALFDTLLKANPENSDYWLLQGNAYLSNNQSLQAAKNMEIVRRMGKAQPSTLTLLGDIYMNHQSADLALDAYTAAIKLASKDDMKSLIRAAELLQRSGNFDQAKTMISQISDSMETQMSKNQKLELLTIRAKIARSEGDNEAAVATLQQIVEEDSLNGEAIIELAKYYAEQGDMPRAITRFEEARKIEGFERPALVAHAQALVRESQYVKALPLLKRALKIRSDSNLEDFTNRVERAANRQS